MTAFTRKQVSLTQENLSRLQEWADLYRISESELVRRAIEAYDPEETMGSSIAKLQERDTAAVLVHMTKTLQSAQEYVERSNARATAILKNLNDPAQRTAIATEVRQEIADNPGFLDGVADLI